MSSSSRYTTGDINVASFLSVRGIEPTDVIIQRNDRRDGKATLFYENEDVHKIVDEFYSEPSPMVNLKEYNAARVGIMSLINKAKRNAG